MAADLGSGDILLYGLLLSHAHCPRLCLYPSRVNCKLTTSEATQGTLLPAVWQCRGLQSRRHSMPTVQSLRLAHMYRCRVLPATACITAQKLQCRAQYDRPRLQQPVWENVYLQLTPHTDRSCNGSHTAATAGGHVDDACVSAQELQQQASSAGAARDAAEADLARVKSKGADIQRKACADAQPCVLLASIPILMRWTFHSMMLPPHLVTDGSNRAMPYY